MNKNKLKAAMIMNGDTAEKLAEALGISRTTLSSKMNEYKGAGFTQKEIIVMKERYNLSPQMIDEIFFAVKRHTSRE